MCRLRLGLRTGGTGLPQRTLPSRLPCPPRNRREHQAVKSSAAESFGNSVVKVPDCLGQIAPAVSPCCLLLQPEASGVEAAVPQNTVGEVSDLLVAGQMSS